MDVRGKFREHEIPLTNRVRGPLYTLRTEFFSLRSEVSASCIERRREMDEIRIEWLMTPPRIPEFLTALEINLPNGSFLKDFSCTKLHHLVLVVFTATKNGLFREQ